MTKKVKTSINKRINNNNLTFKHFPWNFVTSKFPCPSLPSSMDQHGCSATQPTFDLLTASKYAIYGLQALALLFTRYHFRLLRFSVYVTQNHSRTFFFSRYGTWTHAILDCEVWLYVFSTLIWGKQRYFTSQKKMGIHNLKFSVDCRRTNTVHCGTGLLS